MPKLVSWFLSQRWQLPISVVCAITFLGGMPDLAGQSTWVQLTLDYRDTTFRPLPFTLRPLPLTSPEGRQLFAQLRKGEITAYRDASCTRAFTWRELEAEIYYLPQLLKRAKPKSSVALPDYQLHIAFATGSTSALLSLSIRQPGNPNFLPYQLYLTGSSPALQTWLDNLPVEGDYNAIAPHTRLGTVRRQMNQNPSVYSECPELDAVFDGATVSFLVPLRKLSPIQREQADSLPLGDFSLNRQLAQSCLPNLFGQVLTGKLKLYHPLSHKKLKVSSLYDNLAAHSANLPLTKGKPVKGFDYSPFLQALELKGTLRTLGDSLHFLPEQIGLVWGDSANAMAEENVGYVWLKDILKRSPTCLGDNLAERLARREYLHFVVALNASLPLTVQESGLVTALLTSTRAKQIPTRDCLLRQMPALRQSFHSSTRPR